MGEELDMEGGGRDLGTEGEGAGPETWRAWGVGNSLHTPTTPLPGLHCPELPLGVAVQLSALTRPQYLLGEGI